MFIELLQGTPLDDYSEAVTSLVEGCSDAGGDDKVDASGKDTVGKLQTVYNVYLKIDEHILEIVD